MTSVLAGPRVQLLGDQRPRLWSLPVAGDWQQGDDAVELARQAGLVLDDWQRYVLRHALAMRGGKWAAFEVCLIVSRQNGKGSVIEALELAALFLFEDVELILHSAHKFDTAADAFRRILALIESNPDFNREVKKVVRSHGSESIELHNGKRLRFIARSSGSGRGFAADLVILDEAFNIGEDAMASMLPTMSTRPNPQVWYTSTAGMPTSVQLGRVRGRGVAGNDPSLAFFEWSVDSNDYDAAVPAEWAKANPGLGIRITEDYVALERAALSPEDFARERLGVGMYPTDLADAWQVISRDVWLSLTDARSVPEDPVVFAADAMPQGTHAAIGIAGRRSDGLLHVEVPAELHQPGTAWVVPKLIEMVRKHDPCAVVIDPTGQGGSLIGPLEQAGIEVLKPTARDAGQACGQFFEAVTDSRELRHRGDPALMTALGGAQTRPLSDAWAWARRSAAVDISPLVAVTLAAWGHGVKAPVADPGVWII
jgi:phage terminase large subunit-like protein